MLILTALGSLPAIRAAAAAFDGLDPSPADAVSWFEEGAGKFRLEVYIGTEQDADAATAVIAQVAPDIHVHKGALEDADWVAMALDGLPPVNAGRFVVAGAHALNRVRGGAKRIWIEASEAFGTGHHGTTKGCLLALEDVLRRAPVPRRVLDVGAGSGVLAIAAAKAGAKALAVEIDPRAAAIMGENIANNRVSARVRWLAADGAKTASAPDRYELIFANILMRPLIRLSPILTRALKPGGRLVLSGLLTRQEPLVRLAYASRGLTLEHRYAREAWSTLVWRRPHA
ncbi:MAG: 50S ribosomal protein L11 methyltransferase [Alphaproteobacteria bacterium]|nr:50S ribosomal protein L11 methyltransferase [Alphaproteobacteria bacterium]